MEYLETFSNDGLQDRMMASSFIKNQFDKSINIELKPGEDLLQDILNKKRKNSFESNDNEEEKFRLNLKSHSRFLRKKRGNTCFADNIYSINQSKDSK